MSRDKKIAEEKIEGFSLSREEL
jgi:hypothetical protein